MAVWIIVIASFGGVLFRPWRLLEAVWAVLGALCLVASSLVPISDAWAAILRGTDVYLFLAGMMLVAELAREEGVFDWLATHAARHADGSAARLFALIYGVGTLMTVFLSNDITAMVLTPRRVCGHQNGGGRAAGGIGLIRSCCAPSIEDQTRTLHPALFPLPKKEIAVLN
jgi:arsenical pump membrane protein